MMVVRRALLVAAPGLCVLAAAPPAHARRRRVTLPSTGLRRGSRVPSGVTVMTREELRSCLDLQRRLEALGVELDAQAARISASEAEVSAFGARLSVLQTTVNVYSQQSVDGFNALVQAHRTRVDAHNRLLGGYNAQVEAHGRLISEFNARCANRSYYVEDMTEVRS
jgi:hypothetical protein